MHYGGVGVDDEQGTGLHYGGDGVDYEQGAGLPYHVHGVYRHLCREDSILLVELELGVEADCVAGQGVLVREVGLALITFILRKIKR